jgi:hypothetical protein
MTLKSHTTADQVRELGLSVGDVIIGRESYGLDWSDSELTLIFVGDEVAIFSERNRNNLNGAWTEPRECSNWTLSFRDWVKV